ncbi:5'/3'-nucleotidase SurE [bacterium]|nr:5'/3'-nucleotidase SurE [bacterium]
MSPKSPRKRILLTNDDGVRAEGLRAAYAELTKIADVTVVAPTEQRSGMSHTITLEQPLRAKPLADLPGFMVDYTPVDCVKLALKVLLKEKPDLVVSGINQGANAGHLVHYSGTVGAAVEAVLNDVPAVSSSLCGWAKVDFGFAARVTRELCSRVLSGLPLPPNVVLNINVPNVPESLIKGYRWCRQSQRMLRDEYDTRTDPRGQPYHWLTGVFDFEGGTPDDDLTAVKEGYVALTPLTVDWTHERTMALLRESGLADGLAP